MGWTRKSPIHYEAHVGGRTLVVYRFKEHAGEWDVGVAGTTYWSREKELNNAIAKGVQLLCSLIKKDLEEAQELRHSFVGDTMTIGE